MNDNHSYIKQKPNAVSPDFPFRTIYGNISKLEALPKLKQHSPSLNLRTQKLNQYNNELPDIFRLDSMIIVMIYITILILMMLFLLIERNYTRI